MQLYDVMVGKATSEEFMQAYNRYVEQEHKKALIRMYDDELHYLLNKLIRTRKDLAYLKDIELWDPHLLTQVDKIRMKDLREYIAVLEKRESEVKAELKQLLD